VSAIVLLIRHGLTDAVGVRLTARLPGIALNERGIEQVTQLRDRLRDVAIAAVYSSPLERARATAAQIARAHALDVIEFEPLNEVDFGEWTGRTLEELSADRAWARFNASRADADVPGGERAVDVQRRIVAALDELRQRHDREIIAAVSHGDVIRAAVLHAAATPLDLWHRFEISPASISVIAYNDGQPRLLGVNEVPGRFAFDTP